MKHLASVMALMGLFVAACAAGPDTAELSTSVFRVRGEGCRVANIGTAFAIEPDVLLTNAHVVAGVTSNLVVTAIDGTATPAIVVAWDPIDDLALLVAEGLDATPLSLGEARRGAAVLVDARVEAELDLIDVEINRLVDIESGDIYDEGVYLRKGMEVVGDISPGSSGSPILLDGLVVGAVFAETREGGLVFATSASEIVELLDEDRPTSEVPTGRCRR